MQKFLEDYFEREVYYYNVVTWLDTCLYALTSLGEMYRRELKKKM